MCRSKTLHNFAPPATDDEIQHVNMLFLNFMPDVKDRTQTPVRLTEPALRAG